MTAILTTLASFNDTDGANPYAGLIEDPAGNLFGTTGRGGAYGGGTVFELTKTASGYARHADRAGQLRRHERQQPRGQPHRRRGLATCSVPLR
jgi:uncharacterized repeat protein (TIGR03803 family)